MPDCQIWQFSASFCLVLAWIAKSRPAIQAVSFLSDKLLGTLLATDDECYDEAEQEFRRAIELNPNVRQGYQQLLQLQVNAEKEDQAEETANRLIVLFPDDPIAFAEKARLADKNGDFQKAEELYCKAISLTPHAFFILELYGNFLINQHRLTEAKKILSKSLRINPTSYRANLYYYKLLEIQGNLSKVEKHARKFKKLFPNDSRARYFFGIALRSNGKSEEALKIFNQIIAKEPEFVWAYDANAIIYYSRNEFEKAEQILRKAIERNPINSIAYQYLGDFLFFDKIGRYEEAETAYRKSIELDPSNDSAYKYLAILLRKMKRGKEAILALEKILEINHQDISPMSEILAIKKELGEVVAAELIEKIRQSLPEQEFYDRACLESICDNVDLAFEYLKQAAQKKDELDSRWAWKDPDLQWIRDDPRFAEIVGPKSET